MTVGTKSVLFGSHQFLIHPWFVAAAWWRLYGFPWDPRLWFAFFFHDLGYWGKPDMDGYLGEQHVFWCGNLMHFLFDWPRIIKVALPTGVYKREYNYTWLHFCIFHSRFISKRLSHPPSQLCYADKLAIILTPSWLFVPMALATGELREYMVRSGQKEESEGTEIGRKYAHMNIHNDDPYIWHCNVKNYLKAWLAENFYGKVDDWTNQRVM